MAPARTNAQMNDSFQPSCAQSRATSAGPQEASANASELVEQSQHQQSRIVQHTEAVKAHTDEVGSDPASDMDAGQNAPGPSQQTSHRRNRRKKQKEQESLSDASGAPADEGGADVQQMQPYAAYSQSDDKHPRKIPRPRPTHFLAFQLSQSQEVCETIEQVQSALVAHDPLMKGTLVDSVTAHLTVMVAQLMCDDSASTLRLEKAKQAMSSLHDSLASDGSLQPISIHLAGLSSFGKKVLYLDVTSDEGLDRLKSLVDVAVKYLADAGIESTDGRGFTPHVTIAKMSKVRHGRRGKQDVCKGIPKEAWEQLSVCCAGEVKITDLQLCAMQGRIAGEYYVVDHSIPIRGVVQASDAN